jgi:pilus assembly protein CpaB
MNPSQTRALWISVFTAIFAMFLIYSYSQEKKAMYDRKFGTMKRVVVASKDILEISTIDDTMVQVIEYPANYIQPGAVESPEDAVGLVAAAPIKKGEQILQNKLLAPGPHTGLSLQVAPKNRAVAIPVDEVRGIGKLVRPGDRIDILASVESGKGLNKKVEVKTLMQKVVVLAVGQNITNGIPRKLEAGGGSPVFRNLNGDTSFSSITVEVTPKQAQDLVLMLTSSPGSLYLALRNPNDTAGERLGVSTVQTVLGRSTRPVVQSPFRSTANIVPPQPEPKKRKKPRKRRRKSSGGFVEVN